MLKAAVMALRESKLQPSSLNDYIRAVNAFLRWAKEEGYLPELVRLDYLKEEQKLIATLSAQQVKNDRPDWKPVGFCKKRLHTCAVSFSMPDSALKKHWRSVVRTSISTIC